MQSYWANKRAVVSGGSSGLGLHIAKALAHQRVSLALIGRDTQRLADAKAICMQLGAPSVETFSLNVSAKESWNEGAYEAESLRAFLAEHPLDLLVNAVGRSDRGYLTDLVSEDLLEQFQINVQSSFLTTRACYESLRRAKGCVVNIASLAGILAGPGMGGYSAAKHALVAMHRQWRLESRDSGIHFVLVCPGPIQRDDNESRYRELVERRGLSEDLNRPGGGVNVSRISPESLAQRILAAVQSREWEIVVPSKARWLAALMALWPSWADSILLKRFRSS